MYFSSESQSHWMMPISNPAPSERVLDFLLPLFFLSSHSSQFTFSSPKQPSKLFPFLPHYSCCVSLDSFLPGPLQWPPGLLAPVSLTLTQVHSATKTIFFKLWLWPSLSNNLSVVLHQLGNELQTMSPRTYKTLHGQNSFWLPSLITFHFSMKSLHSICTHTIRVPHSLSCLWSLRTFTSLSLEYPLSVVYMAIKGNDKFLGYCEVFFDPKGKSFLHTFIIVFYGCT